MGEIKHEYFSGCFLSDEPTEGRLMAVNEEYLAMSWNKNGRIVVVDSSKPKYILADSPYLKGNDSTILDLEFSPFNNNILASGYSDNSILLWNIPKNGLSQIITNENTMYNKHKNKVNFINFNPTVSDVICSSSIDGDIHIWSIEKRDSFIEFKTGYQTTMVSWNHNGDLIGFSTKNNDIKIIDPRNRNILFKPKINESSLQTKFVWNDDTLFSTINWSEEGQYKILYLWDIRKLDKEVDSMIINSSHNNFTPFVDREFQIIYIAGRKEIYAYDYNNNNQKHI